MIAWILAISATLIAGLILLFIQYKYFENSKRNGIKVRADGLWKDAIEQAAKDFAKNHPDRTVNISTWTVTNDIAKVSVSLTRKSYPGRIRTFQRTIWYTLTVDKSGDILEMNRR